MKEPNILSKILVLVATTMLLSWLTPMHSSAETQASADELLGSIDQDRIMATISELEAFGTRAFYLNQSHDAADYVHERFSQLGLEVEYQDFMAGIHQSRNVIATQRGSLDPDQQFLVGAHYDSENSLASTLLLAQSLPAPGADDDASGVAATIEIATVLSKLRLNYTVKYVAFGAEEAGYDGSGGIKGSRHFAASEAARNASYEGTAILDMIGYRGDSENHTVLIINEHNSLAYATLEEASRHELDVSIPVVVDPTMAYSDHYSFWLAGYPSMLVCETAPGTGISYEFNPNYHTRDDTIDQLSAEQMTVVTQALLAGMLALNGPAAPEGDSDLLVVLALIALSILIAAVVVIYILKVKK